MQASTYRALAAANIRKRPNQREASLQARVVDYLAIALPRDARLFAIPGGHRVATNVPGYVKGTPDLQIVWQQRVHFIELKDGRRGRASANQTELHKDLVSLGVPVAMCRTLEEVAAAVAAFGIPLRARILASGAWIKDEEGNGGSTAVPTPVAQPSPARASAEAAGC